MLSGPGFPNSFSAVRSLFTLSASVLLVSTAPAALALQAAAPSSSPRPPATADDKRLADMANQVMVLRRAGNMAGATTLVQTLVRERRALSGPDAPETFAAINMHADLLRQQGRFADADPLIREARDGMIRLFGPDNGNSVSMTTNLAVNLDAMGRHTDAEPLFRQAVAGWEKLFGRQTPYIIAPLNGLAFNLKYQGRFGEAEKLLREELALRTAMDGADDADTIFTKINIGRLFADQGLNAAAEPWVAEAVADYLRTQGEAKPDTLNAMARLAVILKDQQRFAEAETLQKRVIDVSTEAFGERSTIRLGMLNDLGRTYEAQAQFDKAEPLYREALELGRVVRGPEDQQTLIYEGNLGAALLYQQRFAEAEPLIRKTLDARTRVLGKTHPQRLYSLNDLALCLFFQGRYAEAKPLYEEIVPAFQRQLGRNHPFTLAAMSNLNIALLGQPGSEAEAFAVAQKTVASLRTQRGIVGKTRGLARGGQQPTENEAFYFTTLMDAAWQLGEKFPERRAEMFVQSIVAAQEAMDGPAGQAVAESAARAAANAAGGLGETVRQRRELADRWAALGSERNLVLGSGAPDTPQKLAAIDTERSGIETKVTAIDSTLKARFPQYFDLVQPRPLDAKQVIDLMQPDEALLLILPSNFGTHVIAISDTGVNWNRSSLKKREVDLLVRRLLWDVGANVQVDAVEDAEWSNEGDGAYPFDRRSAYALYANLIAPVADTIKGKRHVFIAAAGSLSSLPFGMLVTEKPEGPDGDPAALRGTKWFADAHALIQIPSLQSLKFLRDKVAATPGAAASQSRQPFLGFGDPVLEGEVAVRGGGGRGVFVKGKGSRDPRRARPQGLAAADAFSPGTSRSGGGVVNVSELRRMARLPGTAIELAAMRTALGASPASVMTGAQATEANVRKAKLSDARILALATHGLMAGEVEGAAEPGLVFTPPANASEADDGLLTASEVAALKLDADWVILSACNTAAGDGSQGAPGLSGLARAFFYAGARNLLASHWPVRDDVAARMTVRTIEIARDNPSLSRAEAFAQAMREIRNDASQDSDSDTLAHPNAWAPFTLIGDGAR
jgi:CHAT domain-containing protein/tetratricopeptide (TPR) repeat protein